MIQIFVNGQKQVYDVSITMAALFQILNLNSKHIVVELNGEAFPGDERLAYALQDQDALEVVHFMGGGV